MSSRGILSVGSVLQRRAEYMNVGFIGLGAIGCSWSSAFSGSARVFYN
jgi:hypothetical protein